MTSDGNAVAIKEYLPSALALRQPGELIPGHFSKPNLAGLSHRPQVLFRGREGARADFPSQRGARAELLPRQRDGVYGDGLRIGPFAAGAHLRASNAKGSKLGEAFIRQIFSGVCGGLREVHANKLLHLDLKPANIYLRTDGTPILLDFGAARQTINADAPKLTPMYTPGFAPQRPVFEGGGRWGHGRIFTASARLDVRLHGRPAAAAGRPAQDRRQDGQPHYARLDGGVFARTWCDMVHSLPRYWIRWPARKACSRCRRCCSMRHRSPPPAPGQPGSTSWAGQWRGAGRANVGSAGPQENRR